MAGVVAYCLIATVRHRAFRASATALVFLGMFAVPSGLALIIAGYRGEPTKLPPNWREYVTVSGLIGLGLAIEGTVRLFKNVLMKAPPKADRQDSPPNDPA